MNKNKKHKSALFLSEGVSSPPPVVNPNLKPVKRRKLSVDAFVEGILGGDRSILSQGITLLESNLPDHADKAQQILEKCLPYTGNSIRIGITGVPGVGKSTFIESMGNHVITQDAQLAVLAIDPSSERSKGSILGDKTRMETLTANEAVFIRPSPSAGSLGGVARKTRESILLCEAAGYNIVFVETVGVGQSEVAVHSMVDFFLLLMLAGAGDQLQGIKRGIMEMADMLVITKADGSNIDKAGRACSEYRSALHLFSPALSGWPPEVLTCSALNNTGIEKIWERINDYCTFTKKNGFFNKQRREQSRYWLIETINENLKAHFYGRKEIQTMMKQMENEVLKDNISSFLAAQKILEFYFRNKKK